MVFSVVLQTTKPCDRTPGCPTQELTLVQLGDFLEGPLLLWIPLLYHLLYREIMLQNWCYRIIELVIEYVGRVYSFSSAESIVYRLKLL